MRFRKPIGISIVAFIVFSFILGPVSTVYAIFPQTKLYVVSPSGGKLGSEFNVTITGVDLDGVDQLFFSHDGIKAARVPDPKKEGSFLATTFKITIGPDVPIGIHDVRASGTWGISNPRAFVVGDLPEIPEKEPNNDLGQAHQIELNTVINGVIQSTADVDYVRFAAKKGQQVVIRCLASSIDSRLDPQIQLADANGRPIASNRRYFEKDALIGYRIPQGGDYIVRVSEFTYLSGGGEHFYRLSVSTRPWIAVAQPSVVQPGKETEITLYGWNLNDPPNAEANAEGYSQRTVKVTPLAHETSDLNYRGMLPASSASLDGFEYRLQTSTGASNPIILDYARGPVTVDNGDNDAPEKAQTVAAPGEICGRIEKVGDRDWFVFDAKKGATFNLEAFADRTGSPLDLYLVIMRADNKQMIGEYDDGIRQPTTLKFYAQTFDPLTKFTAPEDGKYLVIVSSQSAEVFADPRCSYRVSIYQPKPDFRLVILPGSDNSPDSCVLRQGGSQYMHVVCFNMNGFDGPIELTATGLPPGVRCPPQTIVKNQDQAPLAFSAAADAAPWMGRITITGTATIDGKKVVRTARSGVIDWQVTTANVPLYSRLARDVVLAVRAKAPLSVQTATETVLLPAGADIPVKITVTRNTPEANVPVTLNALDLPRILTFNNKQPLTIAKDKTEAEAPVKIRSSADEGIYNLVLKATAQFPFNKDPKAEKKANVTLEESTPAIRLNVVKSVGKLHIGPDELTLTPGGATPLDVKIERLHGYDGEFTLRAELPKEIQGVTIPEVKVAPGAADAKLMIECTKDAIPMNATAVTIRAAATFGKITLNHDGQVKLSIVK